MKHIILTGASRGIGKSIVKNCSSDSCIFHLISRSNLEKIKKRFEKNVNKIYTYNFDLSQTNLIDKLMNDIFKNIHDTEFIALINNAATINPIGPIGKVGDSKLDNQIKVDLIAPIILSNQFIKRTKDLNITKRIINITSGASNDPYYGWGGYCASKAGMDMVTKIIAMEQSEQYNNEGVEILGLAPGIVDTKMQEKIRKQPKENFIYVGKFIEYFKSGVLRNSDEVAKKIIDLLFLDFFPDGEILDITEI